jgi:hypothetical protein
MSRRIFALIPLVLVLCLLCSCNTYTPPDDPLFYEDEVFSLRAYGTIQNTPRTFTVSRTQDGTYEVAFTSSDGTQSIRYRKQGNATYALYDGMEVPLGEGAMPPAMTALLRIFSLSASQMTECRFAKNGIDTHLSFSCDDGTADITLEKDSGHPLAFAGQLCGIALDFTVTDFAVGGQ